MKCSNEKKEYIDNVEVQNICYENEATASPSENYNDDSSDLHSDVLGLDVPYTQNNSIKSFQNIPVIQNTKYQNNEKNKLAFDVNIFDNKKRSFSSLNNESHELNKQFHITKKSKQLSNSICMNYNANNKDIRKVDNVDSKLKSELDSEFQSELTYKESDNESEINSSSGFESEGNYESNEDNKAKSDSVCYKILDKKLDDREDPFNTLPQKLKEVLNIIMFSDSKTSVQDIFIIAQAYCLRFGVYQEGRQVLLQIFKLIAGPKFEELNVTLDTMKSFYNARESNQLYCILLLALF